MSDNYGRGSGPQDSGQQPPYQQPQQPPYQQPPYQQPQQPPYQQPSYQQPQQPPYQQPPYQQQPYQQPPGYNPPPPPPDQTTKVVTTGGGGSPIVPIIAAIVVIAVLAVGAYFLFFNKSSNNNIANNATPTAVASNNGGSGNNANTPTGNGNNANTPTDNNAVNTPVGNNAVNTPSGGGNGNAGTLGGLMVQVNGKSADMLLPKETLGYLSFNAKPGGDQQANLDRISQAFTSQAGWNQIAQQLGGLGSSTTQGSTQQCAGQSTGTSNNGFVTNATDILQGNVLVALLTPSVQKLQQLSQSGANSSCAALQFLNDGFVVIADTNVSQGTLLGKLKDAAGSATKVETYNGQDITKFDNNSSTYFLTMYGSTAVLAANEDNIKKVVDAGAGSDSLGADQQYQGAASHLPANRLGALYINVTEVVALAQAAMPQSSDSSATPGTAAAMSALANVKGVAMISFTAQPNGLQMDISTNLDLGQLAGSYVSTNLGPRTFLDKIPADAWLVLGLQDLPGIYNGLSDRLGQASSLIGGDSSSTTQSLDQFKQQINAITGMDFDKDLLPLLNGEVALYVSPDTSGAGGIPVGGAMVVKTSDATKAATLAQNLATRIGAMSSASGSDISGSNGISDTSGLSDTTGLSDSTAPSASGAGAAPQEQDINGGKFYLVNVSGQQVYIGTIDDLLFISYGKGAIANWGQGGGVSSSDVFKNSTGTTENPNGTLLYFNLKAIVAFVLQMAPSLGITAQQLNQYKPLFAPFEGMAITSTQYDANSSHIVIFLDIQKP